MGTLGEAEQSASFFAMALVVSHSHYPSLSAGYDFSYPRGVCTMERYPKNFQIVKFCNINATIY